MLVDDSRLLGQEGLTVVEVCGEWFSLLLYRPFPQLRQLAAWIYRIYWLSGPRLNLNLLFAAIVPSSRFSTQSLQTVSPLLRQTLLEQIVWSSFS